MEATAVHPNQSLLEYQATMIRVMARSCAHWIAKTDPSRLDWCPGETDVTKARTILDQGSEIANVNRRMTAMLQGQTPPENVTYTDGEQVIAEIQKSANEYADALLATPPAALDEVRETPLGTLPLKIVIGITTSNIAYHGGVVNAYQLMYGDEEFHRPPSF